MPCSSIGPKLFQSDQIVFVDYKLFRSGPNCFGQVQILLVRMIHFWTIFYSLDKQKQNGPVQNVRLALDQNDLDCPKSFWTHRRARQ